MRRPVNPYESPSYGFTVVTCPISRRQEKILYKYMLVHGSQPLVAANICDNGSVCPECQQCALSVMNSVRQHLQQEPETL